ncbi:MAG: GtrA family protein [Chromatiales bacterium]|nr:GtrA family protein [Chromatiales bacterium]
MGLATAGMFSRYALVGIAATAVHYCMLMGMVELWGANPAPAAAVGAGSGALAAYIGNRRVTFASQAAHRRVLPRFLVVAAVGALLSGTIVWTGTTLLSLPYLIPQLLATALVLGGGFALNRQWTFA